MMTITAFCEAALISRPTYYRYLRGGKVHQYTATRIELTAKKLGVKLPITNSKTRA